MEMVNIKINGMPLSVPNGISILEAARYAGIEILTLCFLKDINEIGACRICMVEVKGARSLVTACVYPVNEGMEVLQIQKRCAIPAKSPWSLSSPRTTASASPACAAAAANCSSSAKSSA